jgi:hypothetical protein
MSAEQAALVETFPVGTFEITLPAPADRPQASKQHLRRVVAVPASAVEPARAAGV